MKSTHLANIVLWTVQRTGATTFKNMLGIRPAIFGKKGEFANSDIELIAKNESFKVSVGTPMTWEKIYRIISVTSDHIHIFLYRQNSTNRIMSWYLGVYSGGNNPKKLKDNYDKAQEFLTIDLPIQMLIQRELDDLSRLSGIKSKLNSLDYKIETFRYEDLFDSDEGYGSKEIYINHPQYYKLKDVIDKNNQLKHYKHILSFTSDNGSTDLW